MAHKNSHCVWTKRRRPEEECAEVGPRGTDRARAQRDKMSRGDVNQIELTSPGVTNPVINQIMNLMDLTPDLLSCSA